MISLLNIGSVTEVLTETTWTGGQIRVGVRKRAAFLQKNGVLPKDIVLIKHGGTPAFFADLFAVWSCGATAACLNPGISDFELKNISDFLHANWILGDQNVEDQSYKNPEHIRYFNTLLLDEQIILPDTEIEVVDMNLDDTALLLFTSGTTGIPKGVAHSFRSLLSRITLNTYNIANDKMKRTLCPLPTHFGHGLIGNCLTSLLSGNDVFIVPGGNLKVASQLGSIIDKYEITFMSSVPSMWKVALRMSLQPKKKTLQRIHVGSAPLSAKMWHDIMNWSGVKDVCNMYGITETANWIASASSNEFEPEDGLIGRMWGGCAAVRTTDGGIQATGEGEILLQTPSVMTGYYQLDDLTKTALKSGWFNTGDIGTINHDGIIKLTGRKKYEINRGGLKVHPEDIDLLLETHQDVLEACAFGIPDEISGEVVGVAVVLIDENVDLNAIKKWLLSNLLREKNPERWYVIKEIPKTDRGKINRDNVSNYCLTNAAIK
jgi:acyl-coenzyme A synthetase/AMP-(fatty) acid ligase